MVALTRDFDVFTSRVTASFSAVFFVAGHVAQTRDVRALFGLLIRHYDSVLSNSVCLLRLLKHCDSCCSTVPLYRPRLFRGTTRRWVFGVYVASYNCMQLSKRRDTAKPMRSK